MKKSFYLMLLAAIVFAGCDKNNVSNLNEKIIGKWMPVDLDGQAVLTDDQSVYTFVSSATAYMSTSAVPSQGDENAWSEPIEMDVVIKGQKMTLTYSLGDNTKAVEVLKFISIDDHQFTADYKITVTENGKEVRSNEGKIHFSKVTDEFSQDLLGTWECQGITGSQTHNDDNARLEFFPDGSYDFYRKNVAGEWELVTDRVLNEFFVDGKFLATRWESAGQPMEYEYWEIESIDDNGMKWSALRQLPDGLRYLQGVRWKKIE